MARRKRAIATVVPMVVAVLGAACQEGDAAERTTNSVAQVSAGDVARPPTDGLQLVVAPEGNEVRYRVREQLAGFDLPNDAVGATGHVTGGRRTSSRLTAISPGIATSGVHSRPKRCANGANSSGPIEKPSDPPVMCTDIARPGRDPPSR